MFNLKADPKLPHHYIIGIAMRSMTAGPEERGKMFLKYGPLYFHHTDIINVQDAAMLSVDEVFKTTSKEASETFNCKEIVVAMTGLKLAAAANQATLHHFSSEFKINEDWFESFVISANVSESTRRKIDDARMSGH